MPFLMDGWVDVAVANQEFFDFVEENWYHFPPFIHCSQYKYNCNAVTCVRNGEVKIRGTPWYVRLEGICPNKLSYQQYSAISWFNLVILRELGYPIHDLNCWPQLGYLWDSNHRLIAHAYAISLFSRPSQVSAEGLISSPSSDPAWCWFKLPKAGPKNLR